MQTRWNIITIKSTFYIPDNYSMGKNYPCKLLWAKIFPILPYKIHHSSTAEADYVMLSTSRKH